MRVELKSVNDEQIRSAVSITLACSPPRPMLAVYGDMNLMGKAAGPAQAATYPLVVDVANYHEAATFSFIKRVKELRATISKQAQQHLDTCKAA